MEDSDLITTITRKTAILRTFQGIARQHLAISLATNDPEPRVYRTSIARIEADDQQIVVHQPKPEDWKQHLTSNQPLEVTCRMPNGTITFHGPLKPLAGAEDSNYYQIPFPEQLNKKQLRSTFRVSVLKYDSRVNLSLGNDVWFQGICNDISEGGLLAHLPDLTDAPENGKLIDNLRLSITGILELHCAAKVCRSKAANGNGMLLGLGFEPLLSRQASDLRAALIKLERKNLKS